MITAGFTADEIRGFVYGYEGQPYGAKRSWLAAQGVGYKRLLRWRSAVFEGDLDRALVPREGSSMSVPMARRAAVEKQLAAEHAAHNAEIEKLTERIRELEGTNTALGKAIGLLHAMSDQEPDATPTKTDRSASSTPKAPSSPS